MASGKGLPRWFWEFLILALLGALGYGAWWWLGIEHQGELQAQKDALTAEHVKALTELEARVKASASSEATALAVAFAAGAESLVEEARWEAVDRAVLSILELPGLTFMHVLAADGTVRVSSDRKMLATGQAGPRAAWALEATGVVQRVVHNESIEIALPIGEGEERSVLWLGYRGIDP